MSEPTSAEVAKEFVAIHKEIAAKFLSSWKTIAVKAVLWGGATVAIFGPVSGALAIAIKLAESGVIPPDTAGLGWMMFTLFWSMVTIGWREIWVRAKKRASN